MAYRGRREAGREEGNSEKEERKGEEEQGRKEGRRRGKEGAEANGRHRYIIIIYNYSWFLVTYLLTTFQLL